MAVGGRKPVPAETKVATGNPGNRPIPETPDFAPGTDLAPPRWWKESPGYELMEWKRIVPQLQKCGIAKAVHQGPLEKICQLYAASVVLYEKEDYGSARMQDAEYRKALNEFGLTPASAGRVGFLGGSGPDDIDPTDEFFDGPRLAK